MSNSEQKRAILAVVLSGLVLFLWQAYFAPKQPLPTTTTTVSKETDSRNNSASSPVKTGQESTATTNQNTTTTATATAVAEPAQVPVEVKKFTLTDGIRSYVIDSNLTLQSVDNKNSVFKFNEVTGKDQSLKVALVTTAGSEQLFFDFKDQSRDNIIQATNAKYDIDLTLRLTDKGLLSYQISSKNAYRYQLSMDSEPAEGGVNMMREFIYFSEDVDRISVGDSETGEGKFKWFGIDYNYHFAGFIFHDKQSVTFRAFEKDSSLIVKSVNPTNVLSGDFVFVKKEYDYLKELGHQLDLTVDFGILGIIAVPMLHSLQWIYKYIPNYGLALIVLTIFIRMLLFPLSFSSFKSMKKMQKIQPELQKLKEKHKDDPQRMQKETMELFKRAGANPLGGCLPMLLQMPIFFAFYKVLYGAVELVGAPFYGWIHDLSVADPYYVLPVFMALSMFAQQKLTPTTSADPTQQKVMMFMPLIFGFIMKDLPAGLNLYIAVSTLFGIGQQLLVYKLTD